MKLLKNWIEKIKKRRQEKLKDQIIRSRQEVWDMAYNRPNPWWLNNEEKKHYTK